MSQYDNSVADNSSSDGSGQRPQKTRRGLPKGQISSPQQPPDAMVVEAQIPPTLYSHEQAAAFLNVSPETLYQWRHHRRHIIPTYKVGKLLRYKLSDLIAFVESRREV